MNRNQLFTAINKLCIDMDNKYYTNSGGCCYVAAILAENLENVNIPYEIIHFDLYSCHYAIKVSDRYLNRGQYRSYEIIYDTLKTSKDLYNRYYNKDWNPNYDRKKWNPVVSKRIRMLFKKYENSRT